MATNLTDDDWDSHQATIRSLYLTENKTLQGPSGVMEEMSTKYGFHTTKAQYEKRFKKWGFQKNKKKDVWKAVARKVMKRKKEDKDSEVRIDGEVVSMKRLRKELSRYGYESAIPYNFRAPTPKTPEDSSLVVYTPLTGDPELKWPLSLPWLRFEREFLQGQYLRDFNSSFALGRQPDQFSHAILSSFSGNISAPSGQTGADRAAKVLNYIIPEAHEGQNPAMARSIFSPNSPGSLLETLKLPLFTLSNNLTNDLRNTKITINFVRKFSEMWTELGHKPLINMSTEPTMVALLEKTFQMACGSLELNVMEFCLKIGVSPDLTIWDGDYKVFLKPIQKAAFENSIKAAELLVHNGADVNKTGSPKQPTALSIALLYGDLQVLSKMLLRSGANINQQFDLTTITQYHNKLRFKSIPMHKWLGDFYPLSTLVVKYGMKSRTSDFELLQKILGQAAAESRSKSLHEEYLAHLMLLTVLMCSPDTIRKVILALICNGGNINTDSIFGISPMSLIYCTRVVNYSSLLFLGAKPTPARTSRYFDIRPAALHCAALHGDLNIVQSLLEAGADVNHYITLDDADFELNSEILWLPQLARDVPYASLLLQRYHTPLQFALAVSGLGFAKGWNSWTKREIASLLLYSGAKIFGGEMADAVELGNLELIQLLHHKHSASLNDKSLYGLTAVQTAIQDGFDNIVKFLVDCGAKLEGREISDAIIASRPNELLEFLKSHQATSCPRELGLKEIFVRAFGTEKTGIVAKVLDLFPFFYDSSVLCAAVGGTQCSANEMGLAKLFEDFLKRCPSVTSTKAENSAIAMAAYYRNTTILNILLRKFTLLKSQVCFVPFDSMEHLLHGSVFFGLPAEWAYRLRAGRFVECSPLAVAIKSENGEMLRRLLHHGFFPDTASLLLAITLNRRELLIELFDEGADPNQRYSKFDTLLQRAIRLNRTEIIQDLLELKVNVNADPPTAPWGGSFTPRTALQLAVGSKNVDLVQKLIDLGADVNAPAAQNSGATALQLAAANGHIGLAKSLIELGADINASGAEISGRTALEIAAEYGRIDMIQFFLDTVPGALTEDDHAPQYIRAVRFAERNGHMAAAMILKNSRAWTQRDYDLYEEHENIIDQKR